MSAGKGGRAPSGSSGSATSDAMRRFSSAGSAVLLQLSVLPAAQPSDSCRKLTDRSLVWSDLFWSALDGSGGPRSLCVRSITNLPVYDYLKPASAQDYFGVSSNHSSSTRQMRAPRGRLLSSYGRRAMSNLASRNWSRGQAAPSAWAVDGVAGGEQVSGAGATGPGSIHQPCRPHQSA